MASAPIPFIRPASLRRSIAVGLARKAAELLTVFAGVYAAFLLNDYQTHREERHRREQLVTWLEKRYSEMRADMDNESGEIRRSGDRFNQQVEAGMMPGLCPFYWSTDYQALDLTGLLQSGGYTLLDIETVRSLQEVDNTIRQMVALALHDQQLSDELILPNLDKTPSPFYDSDTKRLRPAYEWYGKFSEKELAMYARLHPELDHVLQQLRVESQRNR